MSLLHACTFLFTPGHAPQRFEKGLRSRADGMVLDLEDAVAMQDKDLARQQVFDWLATPMHTRSGDNRAMVAVRLNPMGSAFFQADEAALLDALRSGHGPEGGACADRLPPDYFSPSHILVCPCGGPESTRAPSRDLP